MFQHLMPVQYVYSFDFHFKGNICSGTLCVSAYTHSCWLTLTLLWLQIYTYDEYGPSIKNDQFEDRVDWNGSKRSHDIQDASIYLLNVTFNDSGTYHCRLNRMLTYTNFEFNAIVEKVINLTVLPEGMMTSVV